MSVSTQSYEGLIKLATTFYDPYLPLYYDNLHIDKTCEVLLFLLREKSIKIVTTFNILMEPIVDNKGIIYISIPLLALLINESVELPKNSVDFVEKFDIFEGLDFGANIEKEPPFKSSAHDGSDFTPNERIRFSHMLRIVFMCSHFLQHYTSKTPYTTHNTPINHLERASRLEILLPPSILDPPTVDYLAISNIYT